MAQRALLDAENERLALCVRRDALGARVAGEHEQLDGETLRISYAHLEFLAREIRAAELRIATCVDVAARAQGELIAASKDRRVLERLRERRRTNFDHEQDRLEQRDLDEANAIAHARVRRGATS